MKNTYVMVHGAWLGSWCFDKVKPLLEKEGHKVIAVDLPGHGYNIAPIEEQNIYTYADYIVEILQAQDEPVVLLGYSMGGMSISQAASIIPEKVKKLVYLTAFCLRMDRAVMVLQMAFIIRTGQPRNILLLQESVNQWN